MPYLSGYEIYDSPTAAASHVLPVPTHATNDILVAMLNADGNTAPGLPTSTGGGTWVSVQTAAAVGGESFRLSYLVCTSAAETCTTALASETVAGWIGCVKGNGGTLAYDTSTARTTDDSTEPFAGIALTPGVTNTLLLQFLCSDGAIGPMIEPPYRNLAACDTGANSVGAALMYPVSTSAVSAKNWYSGVVNDNTMAAAITLKDDGSEDAVPAYLDPASVVVYGYNGGVGTKNGWTWDTVTPHPIAAFGQRDFEQVWSFDGTATYTDETTDAADPGTADVTLTNATGAILYLGMDVTFEHATVQISTAQNGANYVWEYYNGSTWATLTVTGVLTATGAVNLNWTIPTDWATTAVNSVTKYYVRFRQTGAITTTPIFSTIQCGGGVVTWITTAAAADAHQLPYANCMQVTMTQSTALNLVGQSAAISPAVDWDTGVLLFHHRGQLARDYKVDICKSEQDYPPTSIRRRGGMILVLVDSDGEYEGYVIHSKQSVSNSANDFNTACIAINNGAEPFLKGGTLNRSAIAQVYLLGQTEFGAMIVYSNNFMVVSSCIVSGGGTVTGMSFDEFVEAVNNSLMYSIALRQLGPACSVLVPLQFGGGTGACRTAFDGNTLLWPEQYDGQTQHAYNGDDDILNCIFYGQTSSDTFLFTNCGFKAGQPQTWGFHASHSANAVLDFTGSKVEGFNVVLRSTVTLADMAFSSCPSFTLNSAVLSGIAFTSTKVSAASPADAADITDSTFTSSGTGHAIEIGGTVADIALNGLTFTGYAGTNGSTGNEAIYVNIASGSMTISITGGGTTPSIRTAGATVNVVNNTTVTLTGLVNGSEVRVYDSGTDAVIAGTDSVSGNEFAFADAAANVVYIRIFHTTYLPADIIGYTIPASDTDVPVSQVFDRNYRND